MCQAVDRTAVPGYGPDLYRTYLNISNPTKTGKLLGVLPLRIGHRYGKGCCNRAAPKVAGVLLPEFERTQFALLPACTITDRQAQGMTIPGVIADVRRPPKTARRDYWIAVYVSLSRATSLENLLLLGEPDREALEEGPPEVLVRELDRLERLAAKTEQERVRILRLRPRRDPRGVRRGVLPRLVLLAAERVDAPPQPDPRSAASIRWGWR
eukprot:gene52162-61420_t